MNIITAVMDDPELTEAEVLKLQRALPKLGEGIRGIFARLCLPVVDVNCLQCGRVLEQERHDIKRVDAEPGYPQLLERTFVEAGRRVDEYLVLVAGTHTED